MRKMIILLLMLALTFQSLYQLGWSVYYAANKERITQLFCINKDKPALNCNGKCYLSRKIKEVEKETTVPSEKSEKIEMPVFDLPIYEEFHSACNQQKIQFPEESSPLLDGYSLPGHRPPGLIS
jgi:exopolysaccharide biosynthesis protein